MAPSRQAGPAIAASVVDEQARHQPGHRPAGLLRQLSPFQLRGRVLRAQQTEKIELLGGGSMAGWTAVLVSHGQLSDSGYRSSSLHRNQRHSIEGCRTSHHPTHPPDTSSRPSEPHYRQAAILPCVSTEMPPDRTSTLAIQASALMRCHPDYSGGRRRLASRSPHGHEQHARATDATDKGPHALQSYGRYLVALYNDERQHQSLGYRTPRRVYEEG